MTALDQPASQIPNQEFYVKLDNALYDKPREIYVSKLLEVCYANANTISWYRSILASWAQSVPSCPVGVLKARRKTEKSSRDDRDHGYTTQSKSYRMYGAYNYADNRYSKENYTEIWNSEVDSRKSSLQIVILSRC